MKRQRRSVKHLYATSIPRTRKIRGLLMSWDTSSFVKRSLTERLYQQPLTACDNTSTVQTTRRTFDVGGKKKMMSWCQSWCPRTQHLPAYWSLRRVPARRESAAATVLVQMSVSHVQKLAPVWRRTRVRTYMEWNEGAFLDSWPSKNYLVKIENNLLKNIFT